MLEGARATLVSRGVAPTTSLYALTRLRQFRSLTTFCTRSRMCFLEERYCKSEWGHGKTLGKRRVDRAIPGTREGEPMSRHSYHVVLGRQASRRAALRGGALGAAGLAGAFVLACGGDDKKEGAQTSAGATQLAGAATTAAQQQPK